MTKRSFTTIASPPEWIGSLRHTFIFMVLSTISLTVLAYPFRSRVDLLARLLDFLSLALGGVGILSFLIESRLAVTRAAIDNNKIRLRFSGEMIKNQLDVEIRINSIEGVRTSMSPPNFDEIQAERAELLQYWQQLKSALAGIDLARATARLDIDGIVKPPSVMNICHVANIRDFRDMVDRFNSELGGVLTLESRTEEAQDDGRSISVLAPYILAFALALSFVRVIYVG